MFCRFCGKEIPQGNEFCPSCGQAARLSWLDPAIQHLPLAGDDSLRETEVLAQAAHAAAHAAEQCAKAAESVAQASAPTTVLASEDPTTNMDDAFQAPEDLFVDPISFGGGTEVRPMPDAVRNPVAPNAEFPPDGPAPRRLLPLLLALIVALGVAAAGGYAWWRHNQEEQEAWALQHTERAIDLWVEAPGWTADASGVPIRISGVDLDGASVDDVRYVDGDGIGISLLPGSYTLSVAGSPFLADGTLLVAPRTVLSVDVEALDAEADDAQDAPAIMVEGQLVFDTLDMTDVTDEQIQAALDAASHDKDNAARAEGLASRAREMRDAMQEARREAEEAARRAEEQAAEAERLSEQERIAAEFVTAFYTTCEGDPEDPDFGPMDKAAYESNVYHYLATGTDLDQSMLSYLYGEDASFGDTLSRVEAAEVIESTEDGVRVRVTVTLYTEAVLGFRLSTTQSFDVTVRFDQNNKVDYFMLAL